MKATQIELKNVLGIRELNIEPGEITIIGGENGVGKSSVIEALKNVMEGGSLATIKNVDAGEDEPAEIGIVFSDEELGEIRLKKTEKGLKIKQQIGNTAAFEPVKRPATFLRDLRDAALSTPMDFINANNKDRARMILEALDLSFNPSDLWARMRLDPRDFPRVPTGQHPLLEIASIRDVVYQQRTGMNVDAKAKQSTADQIRRDLPAELPTVEGIEELQSEVEQRATHIQILDNAASKKLRDCMARVEGELDQIAALQNAEFEKFKAELKAEMEKRIRDKRQELDDDYKQKKAELDDVLRVSEQNLKNDVEEVKNLSTELDEKRAELAAKREQQRLSTQLETLSRQADKEEDQANNLKAHSEKLTRALHELDAFKATLCEDLPIPGLEIRDDKDNSIFVREVPWGQLNMGQKIRIAIKVQLLRFADKKFKPVFLDEAERLDAKALKEAADEIKEAGAQAFISRVEDGDFRIRSIA